MRHTGRLLAVEEHTAGSVLTTAAAPSDVSLEVEVPGEFDEMGGTLRLVADTGDPDDDIILDYTHIDPETLEIKLASAVGGTFEMDTRVLLEPAASERYAIVAPEDGTGAPIIARVPHSMRMLIEEGVREVDEQLAVVVEGGDDSASLEWTLVDARGANPVLSFGANPIMRENGPPRVVARRIPASPLAIGASTDVAAVFTEIVVDTDGFDIFLSDGFSTNRGALRLPFEGQYDIRFSARWEGDPDGARRLWAEKSLDLGDNWTDLRNYGLAHDAEPIPGIPLAHGFAQVVEFEAETWLRFMGRQTSSGPLDIESIALTVIYVGPLAAAVNE